MPDLPDIKISEHVLPFTSGADVVEVDLPESPQDRVELDLDWEAEYVEPGTPYEDEPAETVRPGWWIRGFTSAGNPEIEIHIASGPVYDVHDEDVSDQFAELLADFLNEECGDHG